MEERNSRPLEPDLVADPERQAEREALNGLKQFDLVRNIVAEALERDAFRMRPSLILNLQQQALEGLSAYAGNFRPSGVEITNSAHEPPGAHLVAELVEEMCDYVNERWATASAIHLAAYAMWRLNSIHPFADGNGRTSRAVSYVLLCVKLGSDIPGSPTIPDQIVDNREPYFSALDAADEAWREERLNLAKMENLLSGMLAVQLTQAYREAGGHA